jgi:hypothetical protein
MRSLQQYDRGVVISIPVRDDDGTALTLDGTETAFLHLESPTGRRKRLDAITDVAAQAVRAVTAEMDLDEWGDWRVQSEVQTTNYCVRGSPTLLRVGSNLDLPRLVIELGGATFVLRAGTVDAQLV